MIDMNGVWRAAYAAVDGGRDDGDADEMATLELKDGLLTGNDPFGGSYSGKYSVVGNNISIELTVENGYEEAETVFEDLDFPLQIKFSGRIDSPDYVSMVGCVNDQHDIAINCRRIADPIS